VSCTPRYAPPEAINAYEAGTDITVAPSLDIWAVAVIAYECLTCCPAFGSFGAMEEACECARGLQPYPWEQPTEELVEEWRKSRLRALFSDALSRDPALRPTAQALLDGLLELNRATSHATS
jgi:serine/threonine protein kinase